MTENLQQFAWTGIGAEGKRMQGILRANDIDEAQNELGKKGIDVISLEQKRASHFLMNSPFLKKGKKIKTKDILLFTRYLSTMLSSGLSIVQSLDVMSRDRQNLTMQSLIISIKDNVSEGKTLSESFAEYPEYFGELYCSLIHSGEKSGTLDRVLIRIASYLERSDTLKRKIKKAMIYPTAVIAVAFVVSLILLLFVVPQFQKIFTSAGVPLPAFTRIVIHFSDFLQHEWWLALIMVILGIICFRHARRHSEAFNRNIDRALLKLYLIGSLQKKAIIARFSRTLATMLEAGIPMAEGIRSMSGIVVNRIYREAVQDIANDVISGFPLSSSMDSTQLFPTMVIQMISVGEASGRLSDMLNRVADYYEEEVNAVVDNLGSLLEPLIMVVLGVIVGGFVIAMYLPIFKLGSLY